MSEDKQYRKPEDYGYFDGDTFHFNEPYELPDGKVAERLDLSQVELGDGITREDVVHAILNQVHSEVVE